MKHAVATDGDRLDQIIFAHYGTLSVMNEVMMSNAHLLKKVILESGDKVYLPEIDTSTPDKMGVSLW